MFIPPHIPDKYHSSWAQYSIILPEAYDRKIVIKRLKDNNIPSMVYYKIPLHLQKCFNKLNYKPGDFPVSEDCSKRIFSLPMHPYLLKKDQDKIIGIIND